jgi:outer membrane scaffolding protein for murein synthesis (MipA/OmpV family)
MTPLIALVLIASAHESGSSAGAEARPRSDWSITMGGGALAAPSYPGAASSQVRPLPYFDVQYRDTIFFSAVSGLGINAVATRDLHLGAAVQPDFGRAASSGDRLRGLGDISPGAVFKLFGMYSVGPVTLLADVGRQLGAGNGTMVDGGVTSTFALARHFIVSATATMSWAGARYMRAYFGVSGNQSAQALVQGSRVPSYSAGGGLRDAALTLFAVVPIDDTWSLQSLVRAEVLLGDAAASPLTEARVQPMFVGFIAYRL